eukprot:351299-Chlamydomonas_euryale.AAC.4
MALRAGQRIHGQANPLSNACKCNAAAPGVGQHVHGHAAVLGLPLGVLHGTSQLVHHELHAVADAQHWDVVGEHPVEELVRHARGTLLVHAVGAA